MSTPRPPRPVRRRGAALVAPLLLGSLVLMPLAHADTPSNADPPAPAERREDPAAQDLPLGKERFAVAVGGLDAGSTTNWVRLGLYEFSTDGTVAERHWHWTQRRRVERSSTGREPGDCPARDCTVLTADGYESAAAPQQLDGTFTMEGSTLEIDWNGGNGTERWRIESVDDGTLATLELRDASYGGTHGFGYGSNADWDERASARTIAAADHERFEHEYALWKTTGSDSDPHIDTGSGSPFWITEWTTCADGCLGARSSTPTEYSISPANDDNAHRRDTLWHWRTALADARDEHCYRGNSHVKPMVQVIDDDGDFHGWVGVEASLNQTVPSQGALGDDLGVFRIAGF